MNVAAMTLLIFLPRNTGSKNEHVEKKFAAYAYKQPSYVKNV